MPVVIVPGSAHATEVLKWEFADYRIGDDPGGRGPRVFVEFPKMLYLAGRNDRNQIAILKDFIVGDEDEQRRMESRGYRAAQEAALEAYEGHELEVAKLAANRAFHERTMSASARAEAAAVDDNTAGHVAEISETPIRRRGRQAKVGADA